MLRSLSCPCAPHQQVARSLLSGLRRHPSPVASGRPLHRYAVLDTPAAPAPHPRRQQEELRRRSEGSSGSKNFGTALFLTVSVATAVLGKWQLDRKKWKENLIDARRDSLINGEFIPLSKKLCELEDGTCTPEDLEYSKVEVSGRLDYEHSMLYGPRTVPSEEEAQKIGAHHCYYIITPLRTEEGPIIFVNQGWLAKSGSHSEMANVKIPPPTNSSGVLTLRGVLRPGEKVPPFQGTSKQEPGAVPWSHLDFQGMAAYYGRSLSADEKEWILPLIVDVTEDSEHTSESIHIHNPEKYISYRTMPFMHAVYAGTWFSLSIALAALTFYRFKSSSKVIKRPR